MNMGIKHQNPDNVEFTRGTMVFELPSKEVLQNFTKYNVQEMEMDFGFSLCHKKDQYNKKLGLKLALERMHTASFHFIVMENREGRYVYHFTCSVTDTHTSYDRAVTNFEVGISFIGASNLTRLEYALMEHTYEY